MKKTVHRSKYYNAHNASLNNLLFILNAKLPFYFQLNAHFQLL